LNDSTIDKKYLLIGASGFVGTRVIPLLGEEHCVNIDKRQSSNYKEITVLQNICEEGLTEAMKTGAETVILLAAEHRDDVEPVSLYYEVNVEGTRKVLKAMDTLGIRNIVFTSSVAVYGLNKVNPDERHPVDPFNHYGRSKWQAEEVLKEWVDLDPDKRSLTIIRPTVIFGEGNRGNVYNLLRQIASGTFVQIGNGKNKKSMAYVENVAAFIKHCADTQTTGFRIFNYVDKPDFSMNEFVDTIGSILNKKIPSIHIPFIMGMFIGYSCDLGTKISRRSYTISSVRVRKFCASTQFDASALKRSGFDAPYTLEEGLNRTLISEFQG
jgi:nucleoside-diphosphate-sugar epimerase